MHSIYQRGGNVAKSKFDFSLLKPVSDSGNTSFEDNIKPLDDAPDEDMAYLENLPKSQGFLSKLPRNILIGLAHAGRNLSNLPHDLVQGFEHATAGFNTSPMGQVAGLVQPQRTPFSEYLPNDTRDFNEAFGGDKESRTLMDKLIQGGVEHSPEIFGGLGLAARGLRSLPITQTGAARKLKEAERLLGVRKVANVPLTNQSIDEAAAFLPKTHASRELLKAAEKGEYKPSFGLQSQIGKHERDLSRSPLASERLLAPQARELKQRILSEIEMGLRGLGQDDVADLLKGGLNDYRKYMKFREDIKPYVKRLGIPTSIIAALGVGAKKGKDIASYLSE